MKQLQQILFSITDYFEENPTFRAIRMGIILVIPIIILRSFAELCLHLPIPWYQTLLHQPMGSIFYDGFQLLSFSTRSYFAVLLAVTLGWSFAREWKAPFYQSILLPCLTTSCFLILIDANPNLYNDYLSIYGMLSCLIASTLSSRLYLYLLHQLEPVFKRAHYNLSPYLHGILYSVLPMTLVLIAFILLQTLILSLTHGHCLQEVISLQLTDLIMLCSPFPLLAGLLFTFLVHFLWFFGINGHNVLYMITDRYYGSLMLENAHTASFGFPPPYIIHTGFNNAYIQLGGSGAVLALVIAVFLVSRNKNTRTIAKIGLPASLFNISEIIRFGIPTVCNPIFLLPFLFAPILNLLLAYAATYLNFVPRISQVVDWTIPIFFSGYLATDSLRGLILQALLLGLDVLIYLPFVRFYDTVKERQFTRQVRQLESYYQQKEARLERLRTTDFSDEQQTLCTLLISELQDAIRKKQLFLLYQPQYNSADTFLGAEALLRWQHPIAGFLYPPLIIALAKLGGLLPELEQFIFRQACQGVAKLEHALGRPYKISVNITGDSLRYATLESAIDRAIEEAHIAPENLWIEITEQDAIGSTDETLRKLTRLKDHGHKLLIDDFGMGHTSVTYLKTNIFDVVKLDGSITRNVLENPNSQEIISSLVSLSRTLKLNVIAEYVDNIPQRDKLIELGCDTFQGYLYSKPVPIEELIQQIRRISPDTTNC